MTDHPARPLLYDSGSDMEMLQTDVMRFMAILGLCLTAIFALVQSAPLEIAAARPDPQLQQALDRVQQRLQRTDAALAGSEREKQALSDDLQAQRQRNERLQQALDAAIRKNRSLERLQALARNSLPVAMPRYGRLSTTPDGSGETAKKGPPVERQRAPTRSVPRAATPPNEPHPAAPDESVVSVKRQSGPAPEPVSPTPEHPEGFVLRFASPQALEALVAGGEVRFLVLADGRAWAWRLQGGIPGLVEERPPIRYHEMTPETVPQRFRQALSGTDATGDPVWAVVLPSHLEKRLQQLTRGRRGGVLEILASGRVRMQEGG